MLRQLFQRDGRKVRLNIIHDEKVIGQVRRLRRVHLKIFSVPLQDANEFQNQTTAQKLFGEFVAAVFFGKHAQNIFAKKIIVRRVEEQIFYYTFAVKTFGEKFIDGVGTFNQRRERFVKTFTAQIYFKNYDGVAERLDRVKSFGRQNYYITRRERQVVKADVENAFAEDASYLEMRVPMKNRGRITVVTFDCDYSVGRFFTVNLIRKKFGDNQPTFQRIFFVYGLQKSLQGLRRPGGGVITFVKQFVFVQREVQIFHGHQLSFFGFKKNQLNRQIWFCWFV